MRRSNEPGFSLVEVVVAVALIATGVSALAHVMVVTGRASANAHQLTMAQTAARERMEQLRALAWTSDGGGVPISDWSTSLASTPPAHGGPGLGASVSALATNTAGYCDFLDASGGWIGAGTRAPLGTAWVRRWSIAAMDGAEDTLVLQVLVIPSRAANVNAGTRSGSAANGTWLVSMHRRRSR